MKIIRSGLCVVAITFLIGCGTSGWGVFAQKTASAERVVENGGFKIRVQRFSAFLGKNRYIYEVAKDNSQWRQVFEQTYDDALPLSAFDMTVVNSHIAHFFTLTVYGVTVDGGATWSFFDVYKAAKMGKEKLGEFSRIEVKVNSDGSGTIYMQVKDHRDKNDVQFVTTDFGRTWNLVR